MATAEKYSYATRKNIERKTVRKNPLNKLFFQGRRWSDGLHQAVEAKEGLPIQNESITLASISYQNFFLQVGNTYFSYFEYSYFAFVMHNFYYAVVSKTLRDDWYCINRECRI